MNIMELGAIGELVGGVAVIASLIYVAAQIRQNTRAVTAATFQAVSENDTRLLTLAAENAEVGVLYEKVFLETEQLTRGEALRAGFLFRGIFRTWENVFYQAEHGLLDRDVYEGYRNTLADTLRVPFVRDWWPTQREGYGPAFGSFVDRLVGESKGEKAVHYLSHSRNYADPISVQPEDERDA